MKISQQDQRLEISDNPLMMWFPAGLFTAVGAAFIVLGVQEAGRGQAPYVVAAAIGIGAVGVFVGVHVARQAECITVDIDRLTRRVTLTGQLLWRRRSRVWAFNEIAGLEVEEGEDDDGDPIWRAWIRLVGGERVAMTASWRHSCEDLMVAVERGRAALGLGRAR